jgi:hypothetical protein
MKGVGKVMIADDEMKGAKERGFVNGIRFMAAHGRF